jgi:hypothetical protein
MVRTVEHEREAVRRLRDRLGAMIANVETMLGPIRDYAAKWVQASPLVRQAIGARGPEAVKIASDEQARELEAMKVFLSGLGKGVGR